MWNTLLWEEGPEHHVLKLQWSREVILWDLVHRHSTPTAKRKGILASIPADGRPWHHPHDTDFTYVQYERIVGSRMLPLTFQKKAWEARQCAPEKAVCEAVSGKPRVHWRPQKFREPGTWIVWEKLQGGSRGGHSDKPWGTTGSIVEAEPHKPFGAHRLPGMLEVKLGFNVYPAAFWICFGHIPCSLLFITFGMEMSVLCHWI